MPLGAHLPTSKGFESALRHAQTLGCDCLQIFSKSPRQWDAAPLNAAKAQSFRAAWHASKFAPLVAHDSYLINLAAPDNAIRQRSIRAMIDEIERAETLGGDFLVTHCGAHLQKDCVAEGVEAGLLRLAASLRQCLQATPGVRVHIVLENTAAQGTCLGGPFEHLARVLDELNDVGSERLCVCLDTCHAFAAGHNIATADGLKNTLQNLDATIGLNNLALIHLNDSKGALGGHLDRHEHIGQGQIGSDAMRRIVTHPRLKHLPLILETPDVETMIETNLQTVRALQSEGQPTKRRAKPSRKPAAVLP